MANFTLSLSSLALFLMFFSLNSGGMVKLANGDQVFDSGHENNFCQGKTWCVAKPSATDAELIANVDYVCSQLDCKIIQQGGACFYPDTNINHASVVMDLYYQYMGRNIWNCNFTGSGLIVITDPSSNNCQYP